MTSVDPNSAVLVDVATPALVVEAALLDANIERMHAAARRAGVGLRPHAKTHKSPDIARRQRRAGAIGIACATVREAEDMSAAGIRDLLITSPVSAPGSSSVQSSFIAAPPSCWSPTTRRRLMQSPPPLAPTTYPFGSSSMWMSAKPEPAS